MSQASMPCGAASPTAGHDDADGFGTIPAVAMLAATALGFAINAGSTYDSVRRLMALAESEADLLMQACAAALQLCVSPDQDRMIAADLLGRAARRCSDRGVSLIGVAEQTAGPALPIIGEPPTGWSVEFADVQGALDPSPVR